MKSFGVCYLFIWYTTFIIVKGKFSVLNTILSRSYTIRNEFLQFIFQGSAQEKNVQLQYGDAIAKDIAREFVCLGIRRPQKKKC